MCTLTCSQSFSVLFDIGKKELFTFTNGYKALQRKLKSHWKLAKCVLL